MSVSDMGGDFYQPQNVLSAIRRIETVNNDDLDEMDAKHDDGDKPEATHKSQTERRARMKVNPVALSFS